MPSQSHKPVEATTTSASPRKRKRWDEEEEQALTKGVEDYGEGHWKKILNDEVYGQILRNRDGVQLRDKWRNIKAKSARRLQALTSAALSTEGGGKAEAKAKSNSKAKAVAAERENKKSDGGRRRPAPPPEEELVRLSAERSRTMPSAEEVLARRDAEKREREAAAIADDEAAEETGKPRGGRKRKKTEGVTRVYATGGSQAAEDGAEPPRKKAGRPKGRKDSKPRKRPTPGPKPPKPKRPPPQTSDTYSGPPRIVLSNGTTIPAPPNPCGTRSFDTQYYYARPSPGLSKAYRARQDAIVAHDATEDKLLEAREALRKAEAEHQAASKKLAEAKGAVFIKELREPNCKWNKMLARLIRYKNANGEGSLESLHLALSSSPGTDAEAAVLARWASDQRKDWAMRQAMPHRYAALEKIGFDFSLDETWLKRYEQLQKHKEERGSLAMSREDRQGSDSEKRKLGSWVLKQRMELRKHVDADPKDPTKLSPAKVRMLEEIGLDYGYKSHSFEEHYNALVAFHREHGHSKVPQKYRGPDGTRSLALFVMRMRKQYAKMKDGIGSDPVSKNMAERIQKLDELGFVWRVHRFKGRRSKESRKSNDNDNGGDEDEADDEAGASADEEGVDDPDNDSDDGSDEDDDGSTEETDEEEEDEAATV